MIFTGGDAQIYFRGVRSVHGEKKKSLKMIRNRVGWDVLKMFPFAVSRR